MVVHLVQRRWAWAAPQPAQTDHRCTKSDSPPINCQCSNQRIAV